MSAGTRWTKTSTLLAQHPPHSGGYTSIHRVAADILVFAGYSQYVRQQYVRRYAVDEKQHPPRSGGYTRGGVTNRLTPLQTESTL